MCRWSMASDAVDNHWDRSDHLVIVMACDGTRLVQEVFLQPISVVINCKKSQPITGMSRGDRLQVLQPILPAAVFCKALWP